MGKVKLFLLAFPSTHIVENDFSKILYMRNKYRKRLNMNKTGGHTIKVKPTSLHPAFANLARKQQAQGSQ